MTASITVRNFFDEEETIVHLNVQLYQTNGKTYYFPDFQATEQFLMQDDFEQLYICIELEEPLEWLSMEKSSKAGRMIKDAAKDAKLYLHIMRLSDEIEMRRTFAPFMEEVAPVADRLKCGFDDLMFFQGCSPKTVQIFCDDLPNTRKKIFYMAPLFNINVGQVICGASFYLEDFFMSRFPIQPSVKKFSCSVSLDFIISDGFYQNVFEEMSTSLPNLEELILEGICCNIKTQQDIKSLVPVIVKQIFGIAEYAHTVTLMNYCISFCHTLKPAVTRSFASEFAKTSLEVMIADDENEQDMIIIHKNVKFLISLDWRITW
uniref:Uncharacterized protein n=1 Tax=Bursaphelenchus xylophilus TaxID=6326 RepID=A0A1I7SV08_BURXY